MKYRNARHVCCWHVQRPGKVNRAAMSRAVLGLWRLRFPEDFS